MPSQSGATARSAPRVCLGVIVAAHGVRGHVKIKTFTVDPTGVVAYGPASDQSGSLKFELTITGRAKAGVIAKVEGIEDRDAAEALKGTRLYVDRAALPEPEAEEYYHSDLIGLAVELKGGAVLGQVKAILDSGAGDLLEVALPRRRTVMVPFTKEVVPEVDLEGGRLVVNPPPGLLEPDLLEEVER